MKTWKIKEAKAGLTELLGLVHTEGPQAIAMDDQSVAVVLSRSEFERLAGKQQTLVEFIRQSPLYGLEDIEFERDRSHTRDISL